VGQWPFEEKDWKNWEAISRRYIEAVSAQDDIVCDSIAREMYGTMVRLEKKYGEHPWILEHKADFARNRQEKRALYERALELAVERGHATLTIRIWLADLLLDKFDDAVAALRVLTDGQHEVVEQASEMDWIRMYQETFERINGRLN